VFQDIDQREDDDDDDETEKNGDLEGDFNPSSARSQFQHIFALVVYNKRNNTYK